MVPHKEIVRRLNIAAAKRPVDIVDLANFDIFECNMQKVDCSVGYESCGGILYKNLETNKLRARHFNNRYCQIMVRYFFVFNNKLIDYDAGSHDE